MKKIKKFSLVLSLLLCFTLLFSLTACGGSNDYYNKTFTLTGNTIAIDYDDPVWGNNGPKQLTSESGYFSYRELLTAYFDDIKFGENPPTTVDEAIAKIEEYSADVYKNAKDMTFSISSKEDLTLTITYPESYRLQPLVIKMAETQEKFDELYPTVRTPEGMGQTPSFIEGKLCSGLVEYEQNGNTYDRIIMFDLSTWKDAVKGDVPCIGGLVPLFDIYQNRTFQDLWVTEYLYNAEGNSLLDIQFRPEVTVTDNK